MAHCREDNYKACLPEFLVQNQEIILLDEPFNAIDIKTLNDLTEVIKQWHKNKRTVVMVTHDLEYVKEFCPKSLLLARECVRFWSNTECFD